MGEDVSMTGTDDGNTDSALTGQQVGQPFGHPPYKAPLAAEAQSDGGAHSREAPDRSERVASAPVRNAPRTCAQPSVCLRRFRIALSAQAASLALREPHQRHARALACRLARRLVRSPTLEQCGSDFWETH